MKQKKLGLKPMGTKSSRLQEVIMRYLNNVLLLTAMTLTLLGGCSADVTPALRQPDKQTLETLREIGKEIDATSDSCIRFQKALDFRAQSVSSTPTTTDTFGYNDRGEMSEATVGGNFETHGYDAIGNSLLATFNAETDRHGDGLPGI